MDIKKCEVCGKVVLKNLARHIELTRDVSHQKFYKNQIDLSVKYFLNGKSPGDIEKMDSIFMNKKWAYRRIIEVLGHNEYNIISRKIISSQRKKYWKSFSLEARQQKMKPVYASTWNKLTQEQRKNHPWVIAGRKASLESSVRGSRNQILAFELLKDKMPHYNWIYNYTIDENWQIDIASLDNKIFIEWDGRHHRIPIHGEKYLNNRKNRDLMKNNIVTQKLGGIMIRIKDDGRFDKNFVEEKVSEVIKFLKNSNINKSGVFYF